MMNRSSTDKNPSWWTDEHSNAWARTQEALRRDWEQTKADVSNGGTELNQGAGDTLKQAAGKEAIPPRNEPNPSEGWEGISPAVRYGYGARHYYQGEEWNDELEAKLERDWGGVGDSSAWQKVKTAVRHGWDSVKRAAA